MRAGILLFAFSILPLFPFAQENEVAYSLEECIGYALKNNPEITSKQLDKEIANEKVDQTISTGLPQITGTFDLGFNYKVATQFLPDFISPSVYGVLFRENVLEERELGDPGILPAQFGTKYSGSAIVNLRQMIFNGSYFVGLKAARTFTDLSRKELIRQETDVVEAVSKAYYGALISRQQVELILSNYSRLDSLLRNTQLLYENGFAENIDVNRIRIQFNNIAVEKKYAEELYQLNVHILKLQMGMPLKENLVVEGNLEELRFEAVDDFSENDFNYSKRIEFGVLQTNGELIELDIKNVQAQYIPKIDLYGSYGASTGRQEFSEVFSNEWFELGVVGVSVNVPIFDGFIKKNQIEEKRIQHQQVEVAKSSLRNAIDLQIEQAVLQYKRSVENMAAQYKNMELAKEVYNVSKIKFEEGVGSNIEITNADADLKIAQTNYYNALYDALVAKVDVQKAFGNLYHTQN